MIKTKTTNRVRNPEIFRAEIKTYKRTTGLSFEAMSCQSPFSPIPAGTLSAICNGYPVPRCWWSEFNIRSEYTIRYRHMKLRTNNPISAASTIANALHNGKISQSYIDRFLDELDIRLPDPCEYIPFCRRNEMNDPYTDYELDYDINCPHCNRVPTKVRSCTGIGCDDGFIDLHDEDPVNLSPGEELDVCRECWGTGLERWCPECGFDIQKNAYLLAEKEEAEVIEE